MNSIAFTAPSRSVINSLATSVNTSASVSPSKPIHITKDENEKNIMREIVDKIANQIIRSEEKKDGVDGRRVVGKRVVKRDEKDVKVEGGMVIKIIHYSFYFTLKYDLSYLFFFSYFYL